MLFSLFVVIELQNANKDTNKNFEWTKKTTEQPKHQLHQPFKEESGGKTINRNWEESLGLRRVDIHGDHLEKYNKL